ncbi:MAG: hypothetical protein E7324_07065 [Clostridiales bacterium]|nr:hypothetical protein [Clostridiales bacterium]
MVLLGALAGAMLVYPQEAAAAALAGLSLWARAVAPSLGPFMVCMLMLSGRMGGGALPRVAMGWLCGSPGGARLLSGEAADGRAALHFAALTGTMSPMFFIGTVGGWLQDAGMGWMILISHLLGAVICGLLIPGGKTQGRTAPRPLSFFTTLSDCAQALLTIALCMMLGCVSARMAGCALSHLPGWAALALQCALEVTGGVEALIAAHPPMMAPLVCGACSFGGLSILLQNAAFWQRAGLRMGQLLGVRILHGMISFLVCLMLENFL